MQLRRSLSTIGVALATLIVVASCGSPPPDVERSGDSPSPVSVSADALRTRGQVVSSTPGLPAWAEGVPPGTRSTRITYGSTSGVDGAPTSVTGAVFVPGGDRPASGWPLIAYAHGTTGITRDCAPSDRDDMFGDLPAVNFFLRSGYAVVTTDYQGLGLRTQAPAHPYLEPRTAAYNVIDAVRAARSIEPTVGGQWAAVGASQGGAAAWSAAEQYATYGAGSATMIGAKMVGAVASVPLLDATYLLERAHSGQLSAGQRWLYPLVVEGAAHTDSAINAGSLLRGIPADRRAALTSCTAQRDLIAAQIADAPDDTFVAESSADTQRLADLLRGFALPSTPTKVPILALYGSDDDVIPVDVMETTLARGCALGDSVQRVRRGGQGHVLDPGPILGSWLQERFRLTPTTGDC